MLSVKVALNENSYEVVIGSHILKGLPERIGHLNIGRDAVVVTNPIIRRNHGETLEKSFRRQGVSVKIIEVPSGERSKSAAMALKVIQAVASYGAGKGVFITALGGGVVGDLAGYVAAVYRRGIPFVQVPTTLLAQIDSAIGGKVAIDLPFGKNLIGAFYQPKLVWSDVAVLATLSPRQIRSGLAEAIKYGIISDRKLFDFIEQHMTGLLNMEPKVLKEVVLACSKIKARVVSADERETKGIRTILNFGHTIGHAIETADQYRNYNHGEAVALGMRVAAEISRQEGLLTKTDSQRINQVITRAGLPAKIAKVRPADILKFMQFDKKFQAKKNRFVLAAGIGSVKVMEGISPAVIRSAIDSCR